MKGQIIMGFIFGLIMLGILKNEYHFYQLKKGKNFLTALVLSTIFGGAIWWLLLILFFVLRNTGALDKMKEENIKHEQEIEFAKRYQRQMGNTPPPVRNANPQGQQVYTGSYVQQTFAQPRQANTVPNYTNPQPRTYNAPRFDSSLSFNLPKRQGAREKIIKKFCKIYNISLDDNDIKTMASASYLSNDWAAEIAAMRFKYNSVYEWMGSGRSWFRIYITTFNMIDVFSAFSRQEQYVFETFDKIFSDICVDDSLPVEVIVENINRKYLTNFDEVSFMQAIAYMEANGRKYHFGAPILQSVDSELDNLAKKYGEPMR
ncbi:MAG: hypothetical protein IKR27_04205 [Lachnospiraceae bacterium]|nr:hypothetical protein [Lachnospiraceae bacterium]